ncbi:MAG: CBS domain-containing protein [Gammaproteobacteria bacterium]|nr:CBS domain-containing protein [Gammaproteobacteria bacterium]
MSQAPVTLRHDTDYWQAFEIMQEKDLHHIPVVDGDGAVVGILTRRDLKIASMAYREAEVDVSEVMHSPVITTSPAEDLAAAARQMIEHRFGGLPVLGDDGKLVGILTETDLLRALIDRLGQD